MGKRTRITKKQLKHDALLETTAKGTKFIEEHLNKVLMGLAALVVVIAVVALVIRSQRATELAANAALVEASQTLGTGLLAQAADHYQGILDLYPGTRAAAAATCYLGMIAYSEKDFDQALTHFQDYLDHRAGHRNLDRVALEGKAAVLEQQRDFAQAAAIYLDLASETDDEPVAAARFLNAAVRNFRAATDWQSMADVSQDLIDGYPDTPWAEEARATLAEARARL